MKADIVLVGTGNVASHLAGVLGERLIAVCSRSTERAEELARANSIDNWGNLNDVKSYSPENVIISVADNAIDSVVSAIGHIDGNPLTVHTSGSVPKESLLPISKRTGVLYPLQTFSKDTYVNMADVPFFTEASSEGGYEILDNIARAISPVVHHANAAQRRKLHIAGVFSSNFTVELLEITQRVLAEENYPLDTVRPLVEATIAKIFAIGPHEALTGPARRGDKAVIELQRTSLNDDERRIYDNLTDYIIKTRNIILK